MTLLDLITSYVRERAHRIECHNGHGRTLARVWFLGKTEPRHFIIDAPRTDSMLTAWEVTEFVPASWPPVLNKGGRQIVSL